MTSIYIESFLILISILVVTRLALSKAGGPIDDQIPEEVAQDAIEETRLRGFNSLFTSENSYNFYFLKENEDKVTYLKALYYYYHDIKEIIQEIIIKRATPVSVGIDSKVIKIEASSQGEREKHFKAIPEDNSTILTKVVGVIFEKKKAAILANKSLSDNYKSENTTEEVMKLRRKDYILISGLFIVSYRADTNSYILTFQNPTSGITGNIINLTIQTFISKADIIQESQRDRFDRKINDGEFWEAKILGKIEEYKEGDQRLLINTYVIYNF